MLTTFKYMYISKPVILIYNTVSYLYYTIFAKFATLLKPEVPSIVFQQCIIAVEFNNACLAMQLLLCFSYGQVSIILPLSII